MTRPLPRHVSGEQITLAIMEARPAGLSKPHLLEVTDLTVSQVNTGLLWVREIAASEQQTPFTYTRRDRYRFSDNPADWAEYERSQLLRALTLVLRTVKGTLDPHRQRVPNDSFADLAATHAETMLDSLGRLLTRRPYSPANGDPAQRSS